MSKKLLVICGQTATGKTKLALELSKIFNGELISSDSRQVYKHMDIGTGKDIKYILGYDLVNPNEEFSVSHFKKFADSAINKIYEQKKLPILVGGTGLYIKAVIDGIETIDIPRDEKLRNELSNKSADDLFEMLLKINPQKAHSLNNSDKKNPRRLIRAIEISKQASKIEEKPAYDVLIIGLEAQEDILKQKISDRVEERIKKGFENEIKYLKENNFWDFAPKSTLGYKDWPDINKWKKGEIDYAKRQMVWFKKDTRVNWFDITDRDYVNKVEKMVQKWYNLS